jgi:Zn-dependent membrane protease YugP
MASHASERADFPGTGGELARHLLDEAGLGSVKVERIENGDHYSPLDRAVRLAASNYDGKSVTAVAVAAHEVGHAFQHAQGYGPVMMRQAGQDLCHRTHGSLMMMAPFVFALTARRSCWWRRVLALGILT